MVALSELQSCVWSSLKTITVQWHWVNNITEYNRNEDNRNDNSQYETRDQVWSCISRSSDQKSCKHTAIIEKKDKYAVKKYS